MVEPDPESRLRVELRAIACLAAVLTFLASAAIADDAATGSLFSYGKNGWQYDDGTGNNYAWFGVRVQARTGSSRITQDELPGAPIKQDPKRASIAAD